MDRPAMNKTIIYVGPFRFPAGDAAAARVLNNAKALREIGYEVIFVSWGGSKKEVCSTENHFYYQGFKYIYTGEIRNSKTNIIKRVYNHLFAGKKSIKALHKLNPTKIEAIIAYNPPFYFSLKLITFCRTRGIKLISDLTEWYSNHELHGGKYGLPAKLNQYNMTRLQFKIHNKILISSFFMNYYKDSHNILIPPLFDIGEDKWQKKTTKIPNIITSFQGIKLIFAGNPSHKELLDVMLEGTMLAIESGISIQFILVGLHINDMHGHKLYEKIKAYPSHFVFIGRIPQEEVPAYYQEADFSVIIRENTRKSMAGFPTKIVESMACGIPVITNNTSDIGNFIKDNYNGFILAKPNIEELFKVLKRISILTKEEISVMRKQTFQSGYGYFNYTAYTEQIKKFMTNLQ